MPSDRKRKAEHIAGPKVVASNSDDVNAPADAAHETEDDGTQLKNVCPAAQMLEEASSAQCEALAGITQLVNEHVNNTEARARNDEICERDKILCIESIINNISFAKMLSQMEPMSSAPPIPVVTRKYEENFMRECTNAGEKPCIMGAACEGMFLDRAQPFVCVRFVLPNHERGTQNMCVLCLRKTTQVLFYKTVFHGMDVRCVIQKYGNIANQEGEYGVESMLVCHPNGPVHCMPLPIVAHQRNRYTVVDIGGKKYAKQRGVDPQPF